MATPREVIADACSRALAELAPDVDLDVEATVQPSRNPEHGDYQCNAALRLAGQLGRPPLQIAEELAARTPPSDAYAPPAAAKPGFLNFRLTDGRLAALVGELGAAGRVDLRAQGRHEHVVVDFSSPNVAKEMHVGHLRSTIIGDALARLFEARGHEVERVSHVGDWGTQFGMLITHLRESGADAAAAADLNAFYREAKQRFDSDAGFADRARHAVVELQQGEPAARNAWTALCERSRDEFQQVYDRLGIEIVERGESFYEPYLAETVAELEAKGLVVVDDGAKCVFLEGFTTKEGAPLPLIVQKADGGYNYATTDLAAIRYRIGQGATRILYVIDLGQSQHMAMIFEAARKAGWLRDGEVEAVHVGFGLVLGEDQKRLRTREGESIPLRELLDEAVRRARALAEERLETARGTRKSEDVERVGEHIGIAAVKYAELAHNRMTNYVFAFDKMVSLHGNTAPYILYAYARIAGIVAEASGRPGADAHGDGASVGSPTERELALELVRFEEVVDRATADYAPNAICDYLFGVCQRFSRFYEESRVIGEDGSVDGGRLRLCQATAASVRSGLALLGIEVLEEI